MVCSPLLEGGTLTPPTCTKPVSRRWLRGFSAPSNHLEWRRVRPSTLSLHFGHTHVHHMCKDTCSIDANIMTILSLTHITDEWPRELTATETLIRSTACCKCSSPSKMLDMQIRIARATTRDMKLILRHLIRHIALHAQRPAQKRTQTTLACRELLLQDALEIRTA